jgi:hypothetical protein
MSSMDFSAFSSFTLMPGGTLSPAHSGLRSAAATVHRGLVHGRVEVVDVEVFVLVAV